MAIQCLRKEQDARDQVAVEPDQFGEVLEAS